MAAQDAKQPTTALDRQLAGINAQMTRSPMSNWTSG
jgi:hypothetical protein